MITLFVLMCFARCSDDSPADAKDEFKMTLKMNGDDWEAPASIIFMPSGGDTVQLVGFKDIDHYLRIQFKLTGKGTFEIDEEHSSYLVLIGGDVVEEEYHGGPPASIVITKYDAAEKVVEGTFEITLDERSGGDDLHLTQGKFRAKISSQF
jgi:hypothetical protein